MRASFLTIYPPHFYPVTHTHILTQTGCTSNSLKHFQNPANPSPPLSSSFVYPAGCNMCVSLVFLAWGGCWKSGKTPIISSNFPFFPFIQSEALALEIICAISELYLRKNVFTSESYKQSHRNLDLCHLKFSGVVSFDMPSRVDCPPVETGPFSFTMRLRYLVP